MLYSRSRCSRCSRFCVWLAITQDGLQDRGGLLLQSVVGEGGQIGPSYAGMLLCSPQWMNHGCVKLGKGEEDCVCVCVCACSSLFFLMVSRWGQGEAANLSHQAGRIWAQLIYRGLGTEPRSGPDLRNTGAVATLDGHRHVDVKDDPQLWLQCSFLDCFFGCDEEKVVKIAEIWRFFIVPRCIVKIFPRALGWYKLTFGWM